MNYWRISFFAISLIFIGIIIFLSCQKENIQIKEKILVETDTVVRLLPQKIIEIKQSKPKIIYLRDTILQTQPFTALLDTILLKDTVRAEYTFPENTFSVLLRSQSDSLLQITNTMTKTETLWYEKAAYLLGGILIGIIINK